METSICWTKRIPDNGLMSRVGGGREENHEPLSLMLIWSLEYLNSKFILKKLQSSILLNRPCLNCM
jgi:hypothetical protein